MAQPAFMATMCIPPPGARGGSILSERLSYADQRIVLPLLATLRRADAADLRSSNALTSPNRGIRAAAHAALGRVGGQPGDDRVLLACLLGPDDPSVRGAAAGALGELHSYDSSASDETLKELEKRSLDPDEHFIVRYSCVAALGICGGVGVISTIVRVDWSPLEVAGAVTALTDIIGAGEVEAAREYVLGRTQDAEELVRGAVAKALGVWARAGREELVGVLETMRDEEAMRGSVHVGNMLAQALFDAPGSAGGG